MQQLSKPLVCGYCGKHINGKRGVTWEMEHVISDCLYPLTRSQKGVPSINRMTIPACPDCNDSWQKDEAHFKTVMMLAGEPNAAIKNGWPKSRRALQDERYGPANVHAIARNMAKRVVQGEMRTCINPGEDERCWRVARKIVRGLAVYEELFPFVTDDRVLSTMREAIRLPAPIEAMLAALPPLNCGERDPSVFTYEYAILNRDNIHSVWFFTIYQTRRFLGLLGIKPFVYRGGGQWDLK